MKATGIVRRIDDLGRVCLPIELRRNLGVNSGDSLEIFVDGENVILRKYCMDENKADIINQLKSIPAYSNNPHVSEIVSEVVEFIQKKA